MEDRLKVYIENINTLGADIRYEKNNDTLRIKIESIITWSNMALRLLNRLKRGIDK